MKTTMIIRITMTLVMGFSLLSPFATAQSPTSRNSSQSGANAAVPAKPEKLDQRTVDLLLKQARADLAQGQLARAESILLRTERAKISRGLIRNPLADSPSKLRRDLEKARAKVRKSGSADPFLKRPAPEQPTSGAVRNTAPNQPSRPSNIVANTGVPGNRSVNVPNRGTATASSRSKLLQPTAAPNLMPTPGAYTATASSASSPNRPSVVNNTNNNRAIPQQPATLQQPTTLNRSVAMNQPAGISQPAALNQPSTAAMSAPSSGVRPLPGTAPVASANKQDALRLLAEARAAIGRNDLKLADLLAKQAVRLNIPDSQFQPGEDRPWLVALEIQKKQMQSNGVVQAGGAAAPRNMTGGAVPVSHTATPAGNALQISSPQNSGNQVQLTQNLLPPTEGVAKPIASAANDPTWYFQQGEEALRRRDTAAALRFFQQAELSKGQLPAATQRQLEDHLRLLSAAPAENSTLPRPLGVAAAEDQLVLARQLTSEVARVQAESRKLREHEPKTALDLLQKTQQSVAQSGLSAAARAQLLRRIEMSVSELEKYIEDHRAEIELDEQNRSVLDDIERRRQHKIELQNEIAKRVEEFNQLKDEHRYAEAEAVANRLRKLAPNEQVVQQLWVTAKLLRRVRLNEELRESKERGVLEVFDGVELAAIPHPDTKPYVHGEGWGVLSERRLKRLADRRSYHSAVEKKIQQDLLQKVKPQFTGTPLSEVVDTLQNLTGVPIYLDPRGLDAVGVLVDTPINFNPKQELSLRSALNLILQQFQLTYVIKDEVLQITTKEYRDGEVSTRTYPVADLVIPIPNFVPGSHMGLQGAINDAHYSAYQSQGMFSPLAGGPVVGAQGSFVNNRGDRNNRTANTPADVMAAVPAGFGALGAGGGGGGAVRGPGQSNVPVGGPGGLGGGVQADFGPLIELIQSTIQPTTWDDVGGPGSIREFYNNLSLVVSQTDAVHEEIADLLEQLRSLQDLQVTIEVRFITLNDRFFERIGIDFDFNVEDGDFRTQADLNGTDRVSPSTTVGFDGATGMFTADLDIPFTQDSFMTAVPAFGGFDAASAAGFGFAILSDIEAFFLIEAAQGDQRTNVLEAPKVTLFNGQTASVSDVTQRPFVVSVIPVVGDFAAAQQPVIAVLSEGTFMTIQAVVSEDQRYVRLTVVPFFSQIGDVDEFTFDGSTSTETTSSGTDDDDDGNEEDNAQSRSESRSGTTVQLPNFAFVNVTTTVSVPDGGTVLLGGIKRLSEGRAESGVPMLSKVPYVNRLFRNIGIGRETQSLMMMVTPRIIIQEEEEDRIAGE